MTIDDKIQYAYAACNNCICLEALVHKYGEDNPVARDVLTMADVSVEGIMRKIADFIAKVFNYIEMFLNWIASKICKLFGASSAQRDFEDQNKRLKIDNKLRDNPITIEMYDNVHDLTLEFKRTLLLFSAYRAGNDTDELKGKFDEHIKKIEEEEKKTVELRTFSILRDHAFVIIRHGQWASEQIDGLTKALKDAKRNTLEQSKNAKPEEEKVLVDMLATCCRSVKQLQAMWAQDLKNYNQIKALLASVGVKD